MVECVCGWCVDGGVCVWMECVCGGVCVDGVCVCGWSMCGWWSVCVCVCVCVKEEDGGSFRVDTRRT